MRIERVETLIADAGWRTFSFVKISTACGITGWSEYNEDFGSKGLSQVIGVLAPLVVGMDPRRLYGGPLRGRRPRLSQIPDRGALAMKTTPFTTRRRGYTLLELTVAMSTGIAIAVLILMLVNQQIAFLRIYQAQSFLTDEAPMISLHVSRLVGKADRFRLHDSVEDALSGTNPRTSDSPVVALNYRQPDGTMRASILAYQNLGTGPALYYYVVPATGVLGDPQWAVTTKPTDVRFAMEQGVLRMTITGPAGERITYSGTMQQ